MVTLTELAAKEIKGVIAERQEEARAEGREAPELYLRIGVKGGGCSGFNYLLDLTENAAENDKRWEQHGITVICDPKSYLYLEGATVDFKNEVMGRGFVFNNPNATSCCGCGASFGV